MRDRIECKSIIDYQTRMMELHRIQIESYRIKIDYRTRIIEFRYYSNLSQLTNPHEPKNPQH